MLVGRMYCTEKEWYPYPHGLWAEEPCTGWAAAFPPVLVVDTGFDRSHSVVYLVLPLTGMDSGMQSPGPANVVDSA